MLNGYHGISTGLYEVKEGDTLSVGRHQLSFYMAPMVHWPEVMVTYDSTDKILFSAESLLVSNNLDIRILLAQQTDTARMIRLHMIHDQKIQRTPVESIRYFFQENIGITHIHRIDQDRFLVHDQIGIIRYTIRHVEWVSRYLDGIV